MSDFFDWTISDEAQDPQPKPLRFVSDGALEEAVDAVKSMYQVAKPRSREAGQTDQLALTIEEVVGTRHVEKMGEVGTNRTCDPKPRELFGGSIRRLVRPISFQRWIL
jgi:hypothetical protein